MSKQTMKITAPCPLCTATIYFDKYPEEGQFVICPECNDMLEVVDTWPIELDWSAVEYADYDDYDYEDEDEDSWGKTSQRRNSRRARNEW